MKLFIFLAMYILEHLMITVKKKLTNFSYLFSYIFIKFYKKKNFIYRNFFLAFFIINILFIFLIYISSHYELEYILPQTFIRLPIQTSSFYLILAIYEFIFFNKKYDI